ncbi:hypothetical protein [Gordonibacter sp.]|uniref:type IV pilus modification PilV family protein n=1 Tax=Gordonibacter sp. TaxID=1968902 RepID=UPI0025C3EAC4|nr:hypothetical protein [Gordonibacter sp.]
MKLRDRILRSQAGETITEVLVGVLIVGLATVVLAALINAAVQSSLMSTAALQGAYEQTSSVDAGIGPAAAGAITVTSSTDVGERPSWGDALKWEATVAINQSTDSDANGYAFSRYTLKDGS